MLKCLLCGEHLPVKSNRGIHEELERLTRHYHVAPITCPNAACANHSIALPNSAAYASFGKSDAGTPRYRCKGCKRTFGGAQRSTIRHREPRKNVPILQLLMNKSPLSRIADIHQVSFQTLYDKIDFFYEQAKEFSARMERRFSEIVAGNKLYIATDRQDYAVNWTHRKDKRNVVLRAIGSADLATGYVFAMHLNFDGGLDVKAVEEDAAALGDHGLPLPYRRYARLWLASDYARAVSESRARAAAKRKTAGNALGDEILKSYSEVETRDDVESPENVNSEERFPANGMQVRSEYTMYAHFYYLRSLLGTAAKFRFFLDQESGIRAAVFAAFEEEISARKADAFYVRLGKERTVDEKRKIIRVSREIFKARWAENPTLSEREVQVLMMKEQLASAASYGKWDDRWAVHPFPNQAEPEKAICYLSDFDDYDEDHKARLYLKASIHAIDRFFMSVRRRLNMLERPIGTSSKAGRTWYGYSAYQPVNIEKLLTIFRVYYNYCLAGADAQTPAMRLGVTDRVITPAELLGM